MTTAKKTLIFIPTFNEGSNVYRMCGDVLKLGLDADLVFMDDNSPDGTGDLLDELAQTRNRVKVLHRPSRLGVGGAHKDGIAYAYKNGYQRLITMDCDFTHSPTKIPEFIAAAEGADIVVGSRFAQDGSLPGWSLMRKSLTKLGHAMTEKLLGFDEDATGAFRLYDLETIPEALFDLVQSRGYAFFFESLFVLHKNGFRIREVPVKLPVRTYGSSKMTVKEIQRSLSTLASLYVADKSSPSRFQYETRPAFEVNPALAHTNIWDDYWSSKSDSTGRVYDAIATGYRNAVIKKQLEGVIMREFPAGAKLLHAGCGSGQVDVGLHDHVNITAMDISKTALARYAKENPRVKEVTHASIESMPFADGTFDGVFNLGVVEHLHPDELVKALRELRRVLKPAGKLVVFWPHAYATSVMTLGLAHWMLNDVLRKNVQLHPPEFTLVHSKAEAARLLAEGGFDLHAYEFGPKDFWVQAIVVGTPKP